MLGFSLGPLIGGALTHYLDWRVIFWASGATMLAAAGVPCRWQWGRGGDRATCRPV